MDFKETQTMHDVTRAFISIYAFVSSYMQISKLKRAFISSYAFISIYYM